MDAGTFRRAVAVALVAILLPGVVGSQEVAPRGGATVALRSFVVPGWGQWTLEQRRGWAYLAAEAVAWSLHLHWRSEGREFRGAYRDLAWTTARGMAGSPRLDPDFSYFERLARWPRSGAWDAAPGIPGVQPEQDASTYNGMIWGRARDLFLRGDPAAGPSDPGYGSALAYYEDRAYGPALLWDWTHKEEDLNRYRTLIDESDDTLRRATHAVGAVLANHVLSGVDAWISSRTGTRTETRLMPTRGGDGGTAWTWAVAVAR
ncbi:MAG: hypothetical protein KY453_00665 [Gemmatimonadetes bacterium]|nr:hypothetical protein [Gemmatimonadota bacterium]